MTFKQESKTKKIAPDQTQQSEIYLEFLSPRYDFSNQFF